MDPHAVIYQFPLRPGRSVSLELPLDITHQDVDRLERFMRSLPFEAQEEVAAPDAEPEADAEGDDAQEEAHDDEDPDLGVEDGEGTGAWTSDGESDDLAEDEEESEEEAPPRRALKARLAKEATDARIRSLREPLRALCALARIPPASRGRPAVAPAILCEAVICKVLLGASARDAARLVPKLHYNTLIRALHAPATVAAVRELYFVAEAALKRAKGADAAVEDLVMQPTLSGEERIAAYAEAIERALREAESARLALRFEPAPARESGPAVPRGMTFEAALRADPSLAARIRR